ncbi:MULTISPECIES: hypothetical protein [Burkholderia cepacia complex]|uniref:hypothetical protein n=1 Tax=Burkholderia cepacia complex TaxID=87882 RepID=UPI0023DD98B7|nr:MULTISPECIES: hypothetical protein [Burkholderia cepacia complex]
MRSRGGAACSAAIPVRVSKERAIGVGAWRKGRLYHEVFYHRPPELALGQMRDGGKRSGSCITSIFRNAMNPVQRAC